MTMAYGPCTQQDGLREELHCKKRRKEEKKLSRGTLLVEKLPLIDDMVSLVVYCSCLLKQHSLLGLGFCDRLLVHLKWNVVLVWKVHEAFPEEQDHPLSVTINIGFGE